MTHLSSEQQEAISSVVGDQIFAEDLAALTQAYENYVQSMRLLRTASQVEETICEPGRYQP